MMKQLLGSMLGSQGGRMLGGMIGGRTGAMIGGMAGAMMGAGGASRAAGGISNGLGGLLGGGDDTSKAQADPAESSLSEQDAEVLISVMANAAKADGHVDQTEIDAILGELGEIDSGQEGHLRAELASPFVEASDMAQKISPTMANDAYLISLLSINIDDGKEVQYLKDFSGELGIGPRERNSIHDQLELAHI